MLGVMTARFGMVMFGMAGVTMGAMRVVSGLFMITSFVMPGGFAVMLGCMFMMLCSAVVMVFDAFVFVILHIRSPGLAFCETLAVFTQAA